MQKVGDRLSKYNAVNEVFDAIGEIAKKSDFVSAGLKDQDIYALCKQGYLERVKKGYYKLAIGDEPKEELILSKLMTHGVVCVESALFYYGYRSDIDFAREKDGLQASETQVQDDGMSFTVLDISDQRIVRLDVFLNGN